MLIKIEKTVGEKRVLLWQGTTESARKSAKNSHSRITAQEKASAQRWLKTISSDGVLSV